MFRGPLSFFAVLLFLGSLFGKIFGSELLFSGFVVGLVFFGGFLPMFLLCFWRFAPESVWNFSLDVRSGVFWVRSLFLWFFSSTSFFAFFFKRDSSGSNRTPPHTHLFCCCAAFVCFARFGRVSRFLVVFSGCHSGPRAFLGFSLDLLRPFFLGREAARVFLGFSCACFLFPLVFCCAATPFLEGPGVVSLTRRVVLPLGGVTPRGRPSLGRGL